MKPTNLKLVLAACGTALSLTAGAHAQSVINISGATLFENFFRAGASTVDFIDVDGDTVCKTCPGSVTDQLAVFNLPPAFNTDDTQAGQYWVVHYFVAGSVKGYQDIVKFGSPKPFVTSQADLNINNLSKAYHSRQQYFGSGAGNTAIRNTANPYDAPVLSDTATLQATYTLPGTPTPGGLRIDIAPLDVDLSWGQQFPGAPAFDRRPGDAGYGTNPTIPTNKDGSAIVSGGTSQKMVDISADGRTLFNASNPGTPDANTLFGTQIVYNTVAALTNLGTGYSQVRQSDLRHMNATGRMRSGENLVQVTREAGSGTRNAFCNSICLDPSFGIGDNVGRDNNTNDGTHLAGPNFLPSNKIGSGDMENSLYNTRLGFGYTGTERYTNSGLTGRVELLAVKPDILNGSDAVGSFARPTAFNQIFNTALRGDNTSGYMIGGVQTFATVGDPRSAPVSKGGIAGNPWPAMTNVEAAAYVNNITASIAAFNDNPNNNQNTSSPGEFIGINFVLVSAVERLQSVTNPCQWDLVANPNITARNYALANSVFARAANAPFYNNFGQAGLDGRVPTRTTNQTYSDGVAGASTFFNLQGGGTASYGSAAFPSRNRIAGDFSGNGVRDQGDVQDMIAAWRQRNGGPAWVAPSGSGPLAGFLGSTASIEILGDFNSDGNFTTADVRYFADGLGLVGGIVDRKAGFTNVDNAFGGNFFGATKATGVAYVNGDSRADIAGGSGYTPGFQPIGFDGVINAADIDRVYAQFRGLGDAVMNWNDTADAIGKDYSANMTSGDTNVDINDVCEVVRTILGTTFGDVNLNGVTDCADLAVINQGAMPYAGGWAQGDVNGDGLVTAADVAQIKTFILPGDLNADGIVNTGDLATFLGKFGSTVACNDVADLAGNDRLVNTADLATFLGRFGQSSACP